MTAALLALAVAYVALGWFVGSRIVRVRQLDGFEDATSGWKRWSEALRMREGREKR